jgi:hypothetical protein
LQATPVSSGFGSTYIGIRGCASASVSTSNSLIGYKVTSTGGLPGGSVSVSDGVWGHYDITLVNGVGSGELISNEGGDHIIHAVYTGDTIFDTNEASTIRW